MKKTLIIFALVMVNFASAQKGTVLLGGNIEYESEKISVTGSDSAEENKFSFSPKLGYQFHDNWTAGVEGSVGTAESNDGDSKSKSNTFSVGGFIRYSKSLGSIFAVYADLGLGYQNQKLTSEGVFPIEVKADGIYVGLTPAIFINVQKGFGLNFNIGGLGYNTLNFDNNAGDVKTFAFSFGKSLSIGISKNF